MYFGIAICRMVGHGKVTFWPAPLRNGTEKSVYPSQYNGKNATVITLFDTSMRLTSDPIAKLSGDAGMSGSPVWLVSGGKRCVVRWPYGNDTSTNDVTRMRVSADRCMAQPWYGGDPAKRFAGDGMSCGMKLEWEF